MKKFKPLLVLAAIIFAITLIVPAIMVAPFMEGKANGKLGEELNRNKEKKAVVPSLDSAAEVAVYRTAQKKIETLPLDQYLEGVVAAEMPADFEIEALKAQALTARTYIVKQMLSKDSLGLPKGAQVTDTEIHQVYKSDDELKRAWGMDYSWKKKKVHEAVQATTGEILTYQNQAITATFFSTSNGYTENSEDYWSNSFPYLRSVASPWDKTSPKYKSSKVIALGDFQKLLGVRLKSGNTIGKIVERTAGKRVGKVDFNGKVLTGKEIREKLDLRSSDFTWEKKGDNIIITTRGYGHGVGMSQYGANGMAAEGKTCEDIVKHYYQGVEISSAKNMLAMITAKK